MYVVQTVSVAVLTLILIMFVTALFVEFVEYEEIAKLMVMPMLAVGIAVSGYGIFKSLQQN